MKNYHFLFGLSVLIFVIVINVSFTSQLTPEYESTKLKEFIRIAFAGGEDCYWCTNGQCNYFPEYNPCPPGSDRTHYLYCEPTCAEDDVCYDWWQTTCYN